MPRKLSAEEIIPVGEPQEIKSVDDARRLSVQSRARGEDIHGVGIGLLYWLAHGGELVAPWWSKERDKDLRRFWKQSDHFSGATYTLQTKLTSIPVWVEPRDTTLKSHIRDAEKYTQILVEESDYGRGWIELFGLGLLDLWHQDNGFFWEVIGAGPKDGPIIGNSVGLAALDSWRCTRTSDPEFPVLYMATDGRTYKLHHTRVIFYSQCADPAVEMRRVGFCWGSRALNTAQNLTDIGRYKQEKLGSRPLRALGLGKNIDPGLITNALGIAHSGMDAQGLSRFAKIPIIEDLEADADFQLIDFASLPDGFDEQTSTTLGMFTLALTASVPPRWLWPASVTGATKADAMFQHIAGMGGGVGQTLGVISTMLGGSQRGNRHIRGKFLPPHLKLVFDFQDDEQDRQRADINQTRSTTREKDLANGIITTRVAREHMLRDGEITQSQFREMELEDGRLEDGSDVLILFASEDNNVLKFLDIGIADPLNIESNNAVEIIPVIRAAEINAQQAINTARAQAEKLNALRAWYALRRLRASYEESEENNQTQLQQPMTIDEEADIELEGAGDESDIEQDEAEEDDRKGLDIRTNASFLLARARDWAKERDHTRTMQLLDNISGRIGYTQDRVAIDAAAEAVRKAAQAIQEKASRE